MHLPMILALTFGNLPLLQFGIAATSLPILIHLLNRRKYREMRWAAMRFLIAAMRKNQRRVKVEQWLLLLIRTLVIFLVVCAMAKPLLESLGAIALPGQRSHRVLVLDGSMSMAYSPSDKTRFEQAKALASQLVRDSRRGDVLSVILMADPPRVVIGDASPSANQGEVLKEIEAITLPHGGTDLVATLGAVDRVLEVSSVPRKEIIFLTDLQAASWKKPGSGGEPLKRAIAKLDARRAQSVVIDLGKDGGENRAVTDLRLESPVVTLTGPSAKVIATVHNYGPKPVRDFKARLLVDGQLGPDQSVPEIPVGGDATFAFSPTFTAPGDHLVEVRIDDDPLLLDNRRRLAVPVREVLHVLLVDGQPKSEPFQSETDYLSQALNPEVKSAGSASQIRAEVVNESQLGTRELAPFDAVVLCNVAQFTGSEVAALDAYLKQGGGLVVFGGDQVIADNYNQQLFAVGQGAPARLDRPDHGRGPVEGGLRVRRQGFQAPDRQPVRRRRLERDRRPDRRQDAGLSPAQAAGGPGLAGEGRALVSERRPGDRRDAPVSGGGSSRSRPPPTSAGLPGRSTRATRRSWSRSSSRRPRVGSPSGTSGSASRSTSRSPPRRAAPPSRSPGPTRSRAPAKLKPSGDVSLFHYEDTDLSGAYFAKFGPPLAMTSTFAANPDPIESDPFKLDRAGLAEAVPNWTFSLLDNWKDLTSNAASVGRRGELHRPLLWALLTLLIVEAVAAWRFGHH